MMARVGGNAVALVFAAARLEMPSACRRDKIHESLETLLDGVTARANRPNA